MQTSFPSGFGFSTAATVIGCLSLVVGTIGASPGVASAQTSAEKSTAGGQAAGDTGSGPAASTVDATTKGGESGAGRQRPASPIAGERRDSNRPEDKSPQQGLDDQLLDELDSDLFEGLGDGGGVQRAADETELDERLLRQLGEGEDVGRSDPLTDIARRMRGVEERIGARDTSERTQEIQQRIVSDLAALIELQKKKCAQCSSGAQQQASSAGSKASSAQDPGDTPSKDSTSRLGQSKGDKVRMEEVRDMLKQVWGHLPARLREQIQSASMEEFLPKYEALIEEYYRRLAEQPEGG